MICVKEIVQEIKEMSGKELSAKTIDAVVRATFDIMAAHIAAGNKVNIYGFGSFVAKDVMKKTFYNIHTKKVEQQESKKKAKFVPSKNLNEAVNKCK